MELGCRIHSLDRALRVLQGRHRDMDVFPDYICDKKFPGHIVPMVVDGKWTCATGEGRTLDRARVEDFKTRKFEG
ncbi:MAG: hypothetical protein QM330_00330 [Acidobacteriota bacterium]|jgi:hypothetical protein|nr:hypothetical protein [Acidobacteriota bacterium]NLT32138.1 hypothetical protein [Acidobacteriota bacterium]